MSLCRPTSRRSHQKFLSLVCFALALLLGRGHAEAQVVGLPFRPVDAAYSLTLDKVILISANPNQLHIYDPVAHADQTVALPGTPLNLSLSPDGTQAAVAFVSSVVSVDLQSKAIANTFSNVAVGTGKVVYGAGYIYVFPSYVGGIVSINVATGQATTNAGFTYASGGTFDPAVNAVYSTADGSSPDSLSRSDASGGAIGTSKSQPFDYFANFRVCGPLWLSRDGSTIYSACGAVYRASTDPTKDMRYLGVLPGDTTSQSMAISDSLQQIARIAAVPSYSQTPLDDTAVTLYSSASFDIVGQFATTPFQVNSTSFPAHGRWVFYNSSSSALFVLTQADATAGLLQDYAIETVNLTNSNSCNATFGSASAAASAPGSYATAQIASGEDCVFTATSSVPWIVLSSGFYGSGNTTLTYLVRPNLSASSRSGTINLGSETFTVYQDAAGPATSLTPLSYKPVAAVYDKAFDKIVVVSASPNELHVYDPISQVDQIVPLAYSPLSVAVRPDGLFAAVGHSGHVSIVDLQAQAVFETIPVDMDSGGMAYASNGYVYAFPSQVSSWADINSIQLSSGALSPLSDVYYGNIPRLDASGNYLYVASGEGGSKLDISGGPAKLVTQFFTPVGNIWLTEDGNRLIDQGGNVYFTSVVPTQDLKADGRLANTGCIGGAADSRIQQEIAVLTDPSCTTFTSGAPTSNAQLLVYSANGLQLENQTLMPYFLNGGTQYASRGKFLFWNSSESKLYAILEADSTSGLLSDYAVYTFDAAQSGSSSGCTYAVSPASLNVPSSSFATSWFLNVTSNCSWSPSVISGSDWLQTLTFGPTSGNGQIILTIQTGGPQPRSGSIAIGDQTVTINQAANGCSYSLTSATGATFSESGATGTASLATGPSCPWSVQTLVSWITITSSQSGTGPATIQFSVAPMTSGYERTEIINIAGNQFMVDQMRGAASGPPVLSIAPVALNLGSATVLKSGISQAISVSNTSTQAIPTGNITVSGLSPGSFPYWTDCSASVAPGTSCSINVTFVPLLAGSNSAYLNIPVDTNGTVNTVSVIGMGLLNGAFEIVSAPTGKVLEASGLLAGASIQQNALNGFEQQAWKFLPTGDGYYVIQNVLTGKVLDVTGRSTANGASIQQWDNLQGANQQWELRAVDDVHYFLINRNSGLALDVRDGLKTDGALLQQWTSLGNQQQMWVLVPVDSYNITNTLSSYPLDVTAASTYNGALLQQWSMDGYRQQQWQFIPAGGGYWAIMNRNSGKVLDVSGRSNNNGALIQQWDYLGSPNQQWQIVPLDGTNSAIVNRQSGYVLDDSGFSTIAGTHIQQWAYFGTPNQQWQIKPVIYYNIVNKNSGLVLDVVSGSLADGAAIQQWSSNGFQQQQWQIVPAINGSYAVMNNLSSKLLDVTNSSTANGMQIVQSGATASLSQLWRVLQTGGNSYEFENLNSGKVLDVTGAGINAGTLLQQWDYLAGTNQQWQLVPVSY